MPATKVPKSYSLSPALIQAIAERAAGVQRTPSNLVEHILSLAMGMVPPPLPPPLKKGTTHDADND